MGGTMNEALTDADLDEIERWAARVPGRLAENDVPALVAEVRRLRRWKAEALPVMDGLQELGGALGLPLGSRITGRQAVDAALDLHNEVRGLRARVSS